MNRKYVDLILEWVPLQKLSSNKLAAGYQLTVTLQEDALNNITGATFVVIDNNGQTQAKLSKTLLGFNYPGFTAADQKPINGFEVNLVGPDGGAAATLTSGQGIISAYSSTALTCGNSEPAGNLGIGTAETANSFYNQLTATSGDRWFHQLFSMATITENKPMIAKPGTHMLRKVGVLAAQ